MKHFLHVIQQTPTEPAGRLLELAGQRHIPLKIHEVWRGGIGPITPGNTAGLLLLGGPMSAVDDKAHPSLPRQRELVRLAVEKDIPLLGICLGSQIISSALGGKVFPAPRGEVGWGRVAVCRESLDCPLVKGLPRRFDTIQWHFDTFTIPAGTRKLFFGHRVGNQGIWAGKHVFGLQFHPETTAAMRQDWFTPQEMKHRHARFLLQSTRLTPAYDALAKKMLGNFLGLFKNR